MTKLPHLSFFSRSRLGPRLYELTSGRLKVSGSVHFTKIRVDVDLTDIEQPFEKRRFIAFHFVRNCLVALIAIWLLTSLLVSWNVAPLWIAGGVAALLSLSFVREAMKWIKPVDVVLVKVRGGIAPIELLRERGEEEEFDAFLSKLQHEVEYSKTAQ